MTVSEWIDQLKGYAPDMIVKMKMLDKMVTMSVSELIDGLKQCDPNVPVNLEEMD